MNKKSAVDALKKYQSVFYCFLALILPDICLKTLPGYGFFDEFYVKLVSVLFTLGWSFLFIEVCIFLMPKKCGQITFGIITSLFIILSFCEYVYYNIFGQFFWIKSIMLAGEGADYLDHAIKEIDLKLIIFALLEITFLVFALVRWKKPNIEKKKKCIALALPVLLISGSHLFMQPYFETEDVWNAWGKPKLVYKSFTDSNKSVELSGLYQFALRDIVSSAFSADTYVQEDYDRVKAFFGAKVKPADNEYTALFKGKNVIAVMMESMDTWMIDEKYTPTLYKMMNEGINFTNYNAPLFGNGYTFGSEFAFNTGLFTPASAVSAANFSSNSFPNALANLFAEAGYRTNSFHFNSPNFYNRGIMHKQFGYENYNYFADYGLSGTDSELDSSMLQNDAIFSKMTEGKPFFDFIITYSAHLPYTGENSKLVRAKELYPHLIDINDNSETNSAKILAADTDKFFEMLIAKLEENGILDDTVIVAFTDHYSYGIYDSELLNELRGTEIPYRVPAFIYANGIEHKEVDKPMMTIDWAPTIVNLFGLESQGGYIGSDVFAAENEGFVFYETWGWQDNKSYFEPSNLIPAEEEMPRIEKNNKRVKESIEINDIIVLGDYYKK